MHKEIQISGCIEIPPEMTMEEIWDVFLTLIESKGWTFGGGREIIDGHYINADGTHGKQVFTD